MEQQQAWERDGFTIRLAREEDAENYFLQNYCPLDREAARLTGSKAVFTREEVLSFFLSSLNREDRYFF